MKSVEVIYVEAATITAIASIAGLTITIFLLGGGGLLWMWRLSSRVDQLSYRVDRLEEGLAETRQEVRETREELRAEMREMREEMHAEMREMREEMRAEMRETREEMRRNHEQLLVALANHNHDETGQAMFRSPL
ncbi:MAG: hypothetical protein OXL37_12280 [Chloroflexota bacterium]|nr:hypothetical protein [Chloroflexota bacterium]MDE2960859.1 hypothetical protein [Chloroflexota bacterium]